MFAYPDAARYRLGVNYQQLPCNRSIAPVYCPYQRDGRATINGNYGGDPNYVRSALKPVTYATPSTAAGGDAAAAVAESVDEFRAKHDVWAMGCVADYTSKVTDEDFTQARQFWERVLGRREGQQQALVENVAAHLGQAKSDVWQAAFGRWSLAFRGLEWMEWSIRVCRC